MDLLAPGLLALLALLPLLVVIRAWALRRRRLGLRFSSLSLVHAARPSSSRLRRHLPFALLIVGLASLVVALGRPVQLVAMPAGQATVILALDVSRSMCATDIEPNRLLAAEAAASSFVERQGASTQIGIVAFAGYAQIVQVPTTDEELLLDAIESLTTGRRTAVGSAILESIDAIAEIDATIPASDPISASAAGRADPVPSGAFAPAIIVLLTDGATNAGPDPLIAADQAVARGVRVYTIGFGTADPGERPSSCDPRFIGGEPPDGGSGGGFGAGIGGGGSGFRRAIDEVTLTAVAEATGGTYFPAESADELVEVFDNLPTHLIVRTEVMEVSVVFVAIGLIVVSVGLLLGRAWRPLP
jgi:Ca-activated chloride channel family protein